VKSFPGFVGDAYRSRSVRADAQRCINLYPERVESGDGPNASVLYGRPGLELFATMPASPIRGMWAGDGRLFVVAGDRLLEVTSGATYTDRGSVGDDASHSAVTIDPNGTQLFIVSAGNSYCDNGAGAVNVGAASAGAYLDGYFIRSVPDSSNFEISDLNDGTTWDPLEFGVKEGYPDHIKTIIADHRTLYLMGDQTIESWRNTGNPDFPFERDGGGFIQKGIKAKDSACRFAGGIAFIGGDYRGNPAAWVMRGYQPERVSTHAIEAEWSYFDVSDAISYTYEELGHHFWVITFPTGSQTWAYDETARSWHQLTYGSSLVTRHRGRCAASVWGLQLIGDHTNGKIYTQTHRVFQDEGTAIRRVRTCPHATNHGARLFFHEFQLDAATGDVNNPNITLRYSNDGGVTWQADKVITGGATGDYTKRLSWRRLGKSRDRVFEVETSQNSQVIWRDAYVRATSENGTDA
jgi:hypothetical protein